MKGRFLRLSLALGLVVSFCALGLNFSSATTSSSGPTPNSDTSWVFFPWVPNGEMVDGLGPFYGNVSVQNLENYRVNVAFSDTAGGGGSIATTLEGHAAETYSANDLQLQSPGAGVAVSATWDFSPPGQTAKLLDAGICTYRYPDVTANILHKTAGGTDLLSQLADNRYISSMTVTQTINGDTVDYQLGRDFTVVTVVLDNGASVSALNWSLNGSGALEPSATTSYDVTFTPKAPIPQTDSLVKGPANSADSLTKQVDTNYPVHVNDISYVEGTDFKVTNAATTIDWGPTGSSVSEPVVGTTYYVTYTSAGTVYSDEPVTKGAVDGTDNVANPIDTNYPVTITQSFPYAQGTDFNIVSSSGSSSIDWSPTDQLATPEPPPHSHYQVTYEPVGNPNIVCRAPEIGGVEKHTAPAAGSQGKTTSAQTSVDGYTAVAAGDVPWGPASSFCHDLVQSDCNDLGEFSGGVAVDNSAFDGHSYLPIVQTNNGWDSVIHITNVDASSSLAGVTITLYSAGGGAFNQSMGSFNYMIAPGDTQTIDLESDLHIPTGWVGSAWITSDYGVVASVSRVKPSTNMALTNVAAPSLPAPGPSDEYTENAPLVFVNYNAWNTGVNIANLSEETNHVTLTVYDGSAKVIAVDTVDITPKGMKYIYFPDIAQSISAQNLVGTAILSSSQPFHAVIDEVKYLSTGTGDKGKGLAMSYVATASGATVWGASPTGAPPRLSLPLVQRGNNTGNGDTSGINLFNPDPNYGVKVQVQFYYQTGAMAQPTLNGPLTLTLGPLSAATVYTPSFSEMDPYFQGSAVITPVFDGQEQTGTVFAISNNVNYDVSGDGGTVFNLLNQFGAYRYLCQQSDLGSCTAT